MSVAVTSGTPFGSRTVRSLKVTAVASSGVTVMTGGVAAIACAACTDRSKPDSRSITARHSARLRYSVTKIDSASCTRPKALAVCIKPPS